jgi:DNA-directed RNA polymerase specialized sigma24 family protein
MSKRPSAKRDRVLQLHEQGVGRNQIAERLGMTLRSVNNTIRVEKRRIESALRNEANGP